MSQKLSQKLEQTEICPLTASATFHTRFGLLPKRCGPIILESRKHPHGKFLEILSGLRPAEGMGKRLLRVPREGTEHVAQTAALGLSSAAHPPPAPSQWSQSFNVAF